MNPLSSPGCRYYTLRMLCNNAEYPPSSDAGSTADPASPPASRYSTAMRTATPRATWSRMTARGPSATAGSISTPRLIGPGVHDDGVGLGQREAARVEAEVARVLARVREQAASPMRSFWMRNIMTTSAPSSAGSMRSWHGGAHARPAPAAAACAAPATRTCAPSVRQRPDVRARDAAVAMSPQIATVSPAMLALVRADGRAVEQRLRRVLVRAVAGVDDARARCCPPASRRRPPARGGARPRRAPSRPGSARCRAASRP